MLKFLITYFDKTEKHLDNVLTVILNADVEVPADDLTITIPYDELDTITVIRADGSSEDIIRGGRFVVEGTEALNRPLDK